MTPPTQAAPSLRAGLRDEIVKALGRITTVLSVAHRREQADHVLAVLYREWPWLRAEAEDAEPTDRAAVLRDFVRQLTDRLANCCTECDACAVIARDLADAELRRMADEEADADDVVVEVTEAEFYAAVRTSLARLGLSYAELEDQARRSDFSSAQARSLWVSIGGAVNPERLTDEQPATEARHVGGRVNAEDCPACCASPTPPPYPWICPGEPPASPSV